MDPPPLKPFESPGMPLFPLSPERVNGTRPPYSYSPTRSESRAGLPESPSVPEFGKASVFGKLPPFHNQEFTLNPSSPSPPRTHARTNSDAHVQGMVARFNQLDIKDMRDQHRRDEAMVKRADMAREMAEMEAGRLKRELESLEEKVRTMREEARLRARDVEEGKDRERRTAKRLEVLMEERNRDSKMLSSHKAAYEKEIRKLRKDAFTSSSAIVKLQEELKASRASLRVSRADLDTEKLRSAKREEDAFNARYQLIASQELLTREKERSKVMEEERDSLKTALKEEEVARIAAEGRIALPAAMEEDDEFSTPKKSPRKSPLKREMESEDKENIMPRRKMEVAVVTEELEQERSRRVEAEEQIEFMKMECQFQCCSCRVAEQQGARYVHDDRFAEKIHKIKSTVAVLSARISDRDEEMTEAPEQEAENATVQKEVLFDAESGTFASVAIEPEPNAEEDAQGTLQDINGDENDTTVVSQGTIIHHDQPSRETSVAEDTEETIGEEEPTSVTLDNEPSAPSQMQVPLKNENTPIRQIRTITTTTTIPMTFTPVKSSNLYSATGGIPATPATIAHPPQANIPISPFPSTSGLKPDGTIDREAALEQIRQRRGRARSVAMGLATPRKQMLEGVGAAGRRDISAPALGGK
ncbi:hypothetical protein K402DRAFT_360240 [Aulographum hederae CBS 113979]|uniref:Uncharacterized protein n=1 Tax=Aulographum hederae CBS 113979 TaxID=1176131 RepID=A0A6G1GTD3_9PEZI|nr:hypothetical protein K402DRAFT_360240 [Aulographum hederae CBS 113979]